MSRDSDYGVIFEEKNYVNDDLRQEFSERVSQKRKLLLYPKLSDALRHFQIPVTKQEEEAEAEIVASANDRRSSGSEKPLNHLAELLRENDSPSVLSLINQWVALRETLGDALKRAGSNAATKEVKSQPQK